LPQSTPLTAAARLAALVSEWESARTPSVPSFPWRAGLSTSLAS